MSTKKKEKIILDEKTAAVFSKKLYSVTDKISEGAFGQVYKATKTDTGKKAAVKVMHIEKIPQLVVDKFLPREFKTSSTIHHQNVLEVFDIIRSNNCFYIFMEFAPNGSLGGQIKNNGPISERKSRIWFKQTTEGLDCMHNKYNICHRDIKPDNVLLDANDVAKLSDFGFAKVMEAEEENGMTGTVCGTIPFYAPELVKPRGKYNPFAVDIWAMGVMLFQMLTKDFPFKFPHNAKDKEGMENFYRAQMAGKFQYREGVAENLSGEVKNLISKCLEPKVDKRYTTQKMLQHAWLRK